MTDTGTQGSLFDVAYDLSEKVESSYAKVKAISIPTAGEASMVAVIAQKIGNFAKEVERLTSIVGVAEDVARSRTFRATGFEKLSTAIKAWDEPVLTSIHEKLAGLAELNEPNQIAKFLEKYRLSTKKDGYDDPASIEDGVFISRDNIEVTSFMPHQIKAIATALGAAMKSKDFVQREILANTPSSEVEKMGLSTTFTGVIETTGAVKMPEESIKAMQDTLLVEEKLAEVLKKDSVSNNDEGSENNIITAGRTR